MPKVQFTHLQGENTPSLGSKTCRKKENEEKNHIIEIQYLYNPLIKKFVWEIAIIPRIFLFLIYFSQVHSVLWIL